MSTQRGNISRTRTQKHKNVTAFKNDLHDKTPKTKMINQIKIAHVCIKCKNILEWKIKYKKFKPLKSLKKCNKCEMKTIKEAYHTICNKCATDLKVCPKCGENKEIVQTEFSEKDSIKFEKRIEVLLDELHERQKRTILRHLNKNKNEIIMRYEELSEKEREDLTLIKLFPNLKINSECTDDLFDKDFEDIDDDEEEEEEEEDKED